MSESKWISAKERLPEPNQPFWYLYNGAVNVHLNGTTSPRDFFTVACTHWMPAEIPAPPRSEAEQAFDDWAVIHPVPSTDPRYISRDLAKTIYVAGFEKGRAAK